MNFHGVLHFNFIVEMLFMLFKLSIHRIHREHSHISTENKMKCKGKIMRKYKKNAPTTKQLRYNRDNSQILFFYD